ncbi:MAG: hypothetical protein CSA26_07610 [Desulfobacterales bacterium]|nr:MAG: hypothetical protein CSA26_07610 [Desulfobacterales bacterium]
MRYIFKVLAFIFLSTLMVAPVNATEYPWEKDAKVAKQKKSSEQPGSEVLRAKETASSQRSGRQFGPFYVDRISGWYFEETIDGEALKFLAGDGEIVGWIHIEKDTIEEENYLHAKEVFIKKITHNQKTEISFAGRDDVLSLRESDGEADVTYIFPYRSGRVYMMYVVISNDNDHKEVKTSAQRLLDSFRFAK